jgi:hypothetical protein
MMVCGTYHDTGLHALVYKYEVCLFDYKKEQKP